MKDEKISNDGQPGTKAAPEIDINFDPDKFSLESDDELNAENLRLSQNYADAIGVKRVLTTIGTHKPNKQVYVRVRPEEEYRLQIGAIELRDERELYIVRPNIASQLPGEITRFELFTAITRQETLFLWPVRLPDESGRANTWNTSAMAAAMRAMSNWVRVVANMQAGGYDLYESGNITAEPHWPDMSFDQILKLAFADRDIRTMDHPVVRQLLGLV